MIHVVSSVSTRSDGSVRVGCWASGSVRTTLAIANRPAARQTSYQRRGVRAGPGPFASCDSRFKKSDFRLNFRLNLEIVSVSPILNLNS